jgi:adenine-specific DNA-methyltransferase
MHAFSEADEAFETPKPERLLKRIVEIASHEGDLVLDCFAGSGTTGAVAHKMRRRWVLCDLEKECTRLIQRRLADVVGGSDSGGITAVAGWNGGGGFQFCTLGGSLLDESGSIGPTISFSDLAAHVYFTETGTPIPRPATRTTPLLGVHSGNAIYLLFNGVLGDKRPDGGNVLTGEVLRRLPKQPGLVGKRVIYGEGCRLGAARLKREGIVFKQIPYEIKVS